MAAAIPCDLTAHPPPAELAWLTDAIGAEATLKLIELHGGTRLYVAKGPNQGSVLARQIGLAAARKLAEVRGGEFIKVPLARAWRVQLYRRRGDSYAKIARTLGMTESQVGKILTATGQTNAQLSLAL